MAHWDQTVGHCRAVDDSLVRAELIPLSLDPVALVFDSLGGRGDDGVLGGGVGRLGV